MTGSGSICVCTALVVLALLALSSDAGAQTKVTVTQDRAMIWTLGVPTVAAVVPAGTELEVVARRGSWYEVVLLSPTTTTGPTGLIAASQVEVLTGTPPTATTASPKPVPLESPPRQPAEAASPAPAVSAPPPSQPVRRAPELPGESSSRTTTAGLRAFGQLGYGRFLANQSFAAVFDQAGGVWFGGGAMFGFEGGAFLQGSVERFRQTGERVFVFDDEVFRLGLANTVTLTPITITAGYYFRRPTLTPYAGGGIGRYLLREESEFADATENVHEQLTSYHVLGGVEWHNRGVFGIAFEVQYTHVPDAFSGGVAATFDEDNLGGMQFRVRVLIGG